MAQYRFSVQSPISRGKGQSAVAKAAYNAREAIRDERTGELKDYSRQNHEVLFSGIFVDPKRKPPEWVQDRAALWNAASAAEKRKDAREAQEIILNLPHELSPEQQRRLLTDFVREQITRSTGRVADVNIHAAPAHGDDRNIHAHILMSVRAISPDGFGERLPEVTPQQIDKWRERWAEMGAKALDRAGFPVEAERYRAEHLSLDRQRQAALERGDLAHAETLDREPTKHLGPQVAAMERKGAATDRGNIYRDTVDRNATLADLKAELAAVEKEMAAQHNRGTMPRDAAASIRTAYERSDDTKSFQAALREQGITREPATRTGQRIDAKDAGRELGTRTSRTAGKALESVANAAAEAIEMLGDMFGATPKTPRDIEAAIDAREQRAAQGEIDMARFRSDADYRRQIEAQEAQKLDAERREYYEKHRERDDGRQR